MYEQVKNYFLIVIAGVVAVMLYFYVSSRGDSNTDGTVAAIREQQQIAETQIDNVGAGINNAKETASGVAERIERSEKIVEGNAERISRVEQLVGECKSITEANENIFRQIREANKKTTQ